ncbi:MAG: hypothetical protein Q4A83_08380 [Bacillota bacterium]|nr:hypothetical protein [Bacillota bacterium]
MKKREAALALALLSAVSSLCIKGMKAVGERLSRKDNTFADINLTVTEEDENEVNN